MNLVLIEEMATQSYILSLFYREKRQKLIIKKRYRICIQFQGITNKNSCILDIIFLKFSLILFESTNKIKINTIISGLLNHMSLSQSKGPKMGTIPQRVNPEFMGIAEKYSEHKRKRLESQKKRQKVSSNFVYAFKFNQQLQKNLLDKQIELQKLQKIRQRHNGDIQNKIQKEEIRRKNIEELKIKCQNQRTTLQQNIKGAKQTLKAQNYLSKLQTKKRLNEASIEFKAASQRQYNQQCVRHQSIEIGKKIGNQRVNQFYRTQNLKSLNNYLQMIEDQDKKSEENTQQIKQMNKKIKKLELNINKKQQKLKNVLEEISLYSVETPNQRKASHLASTSVYGWGFEDKKTGQRSRKKNNRLGTASSNRSRPSQILRKSFYADNKTNSNTFSVDAYK